MKENLCWRPRREGDRILKGGMHREVRRLYREAGLPLSVRRMLPVLCDSEGIVWVPYVGERDGLREDRSEQEGVLISLRSKEFN